MLYISGSVDDVMFAYNGPDGSMMLPQQHVMYELTSLPCGTGT